MDEVMMGKSVFITMEEEEEEGREEQDVERRAAPSKPAAAATGVTAPSRRSPKSASTLPSAEPSSHEQIEPRSIYHRCLHLSGVLVSCDRALAKTAFSMLRSQAKDQKALQIDRLVVLDCSLLLSLGFYRLGSLLITSIIAYSRLSTSFLNNLSHGLRCRPRIGVKKANTRAQNMKKSRRPSSTSQVRRPGPNPDQKATTSPKLASCSCSRGDSRLLFTTSYSHSMSDDASSSAIGGGAGSVALDHEALSNNLLVSPSCGDEQASRGADAHVDLIKMIKAIKETKDEEAKAKQWAEMLPLITPEAAARKDGSATLSWHRR